MTDKNPYSAPQTALESEGVERYQPQLFSFRGRIGRVRYLAYGLGFNLLLFIVLVPILSGAAFIGAKAGMSFVSLVVIGLFYAATFVVSIMFSKRRLNDLNRSGWWFLLFFIPIVNLLLAIYTVFFPGTDGSNNFGAAPVRNSGGVIAMAILLPVFLIGGIGILAAIAIPQYADFTQRAKVAEAFAAAQSWKTAISLCYVEQGELTHDLCGTPGINGVPADLGANEINNVVGITTTGDGVITITSTAVNTDGEVLVIVMTPSVKASRVEWALTGTACNAIGRSINCSST